jgi:signal transduction histidine kinase
MSDYPLGMTLYQVVASLLIILAAVVMALSLVETRKTLPLLRGQAQAGSWRLLFYLTFLFLAAYGASAVFVVVRAPGVFATLAGLVFFFGALFVYLATKLGAGTIAELLRAREALSEAQDEAVQASRFKSSLLANVSHELRTPLQAIVGYVDMLRDGVYGTLSQKQYRALARMTVNVRRLMEQIENLLQHAQLASGAELDVAYRPFSPYELIAAAADTLQPLAQAKGLDLSFDVAADVPPTLVGDPAKVQDIVVNLANNAIKFTKRGVVQVRLYRPDVDHWALAVSDTGPGIPAGAQEQIFDPFARLSSDITNVDEGIGLGLAMVQVWTEVMEGELALDSHGGEGSTFTVCFPLHRQQASEGERP